MSDLSVQSPSDLPRAHPLQKEGHRVAGKMETQDFMLVLLRLCDPLNEDLSIRLWVLQMSLQGGTHENITALGIRVDRCFSLHLFNCFELPWWPSGKESIYQCRDSGSIPELRGTAREENGNLVQYSWLGNPMDR